ncbi:hypothetical protein IOCL2690_000733900 [Leishmania lindenbergi]|uniref:Uncharacterized protein n=1 Tax=Leishmania lindenbergi TaxID=651832 RepID=A0AAW3A0A3_9TRYP|nr:unnamed protein product [Leishmania braziliensis]
MGDVDSSIPLPAGSIGEGASRLSYASFSSWCRQRLLPTLFPSPATAKMTPLHLASLFPAALPHFEAGAPTKTSLSPTPQHSAAVPTCATLLATQKGEGPTAPAPVSPPPHPISLAVVENTSENVPDAALLNSLRLPPVLPLHGSGGAFSTTTAAAADLLALADASPTAGSASSSVTTPGLGPSFSSSPLPNVSTKAAMTSNAESDKSAPVLLGTGRLGLPSSTSPFLYPAPPLSPFTVSAGSLSAMRTPSTCVELPGPQSLFVRGSDALGCSGRSPELLQADSRTEVGGAPSVKV